MTKDQLAALSSVRVTSISLAAVLTRRPTLNAIKTTSTASGINAVISGEHATAAAANRPADNPTTHDFVASSIWPWRALVYLGEFRSRNYIPRSWILLDIMCQLGNALKSILHAFMSIFGGSPVIELGNGSEGGNCSPFPGR